MDPRALRSRTALRAAVMELAAQASVDTITVADVCREAGVTRDTFYRHASGPTELLAAALAAEIETLPPQRRMGDAERALLAHVAHRAAVYRHAMRPALAAPVRAELERVLRDGLGQWLAAHPHIAPVAVRTDAVAAEIAIAYAAGGTVAAIEQWLRVGDGDIETATRAILAASPEWWLHTPGHDERREP